MNSSNNLLSQQKITKPIIFSFFVASELINLANFKCKYEYNVLSLIFGFGAKTLKKLILRPYVQKKRVFGF